MPHTQKGKICARAIHPATSPKELQASYLRGVSGGAGARPRKIDEAVLAVLRWGVTRGGVGAGGEGDKTKVSVRVKTRLITFV